MVTPERCPWLRWTAEFLEKLSLPLRGSAQTVLHQTVVRDAQREFHCAWQSSAELKRSFAPMIDLDDWELLVVPALVMVTRAFPGTTIFATAYITGGTFLPSACIPDTLFKMVCILHIVAEPGREHWQSLVYELPVCGVVGSYVFFPLKHVAVHAPAHLRKESRAGSPRPCPTRG